MAINIPMHTEFILLTNVASPVWQRAIGAYQVASHCRKSGISCQVIDFTDLFKISELEELITSSIGEHTLAIGISTTFYYNKTTKGKFISATRNFNKVLPDSLRELIASIKLKYPKIKIVGGGANSYQIEDDELFDVVFHGYCEQSVATYLLAMKGEGPKRLWPKKNTTEIVDDKNSHFDITTLQHTWHENDCILPGETLPIEISRGCIFKCTFCSYPLNGKKKFDYLRDPELIKEELISNYENFGTTNYFFTDDTFNDSTLKLEALHKVITSLPFKIKFVTYLRLDLLHAHPEQLVLLKEMGLGSAFFGIETFNHESGKIIGKGMKPSIVKEFLLDVYYKHWNEEIPITCSFIIGLPKETESSIRETHKWLKDTPINDLWFPLFIKNNSHYKSEFDLNYAKYGYVLDENSNWTSDTMTYADALSIAEEFNDSGLYSDNTPSSWLLFGLLSYGFSINELKGQRISDIHWPSILFKKFKLFKEYKSKLFTTIRK
jgi:radical SAM superfamily enzyme YgiQ (UPF0313 family)